MRQQSRVDGVWHPVPVGVGVCALVEVECVRLVVRAVVVTV